MNKTDNQGETNVNYLENYTCTRCSAAGVKLWRGVHDASGSWLCALCGTKQEKLALQPEPRSIHWPFDEDGTGVYGYGGVSETQVRWWHALPTYRGVDLEVRCLRNLLSRTQAQLWSMTRMWQQAIRDKQGQRRDHED